jgi:hypothetical protein
MGLEPTNLLTASHDSYLSRIVTNRRTSASPQVGRAVYRLPSSPLVTPPRRFGYQFGYRVNLAQHLGELALARVIAIASAAERHFGLPCKRGSGMARSAIGVVS